jgi:hypothetical protein
MGIAPISDAYRAHLIQVWGYDPQSDKEQFSTLILARPWQIQVAGISFVVLVGAGAGVILGQPSYASTVTALAIVLSVLSVPRTWRARVRGARDPSGPQIGQALPRGTRDTPSYGLSRSPVRPDVQMMQNFQMTQGSAEDQVRLLRENQAADLRRVTDASARNIVEDRARFQAFVRDLLQGGLGQRAFGAALIACGIVVSVAANVVSAAA